MHLIVTLLTGCQIRSGCIVPTCLDMRMLPTCLDACIWQLSMSVYVEADADVQAVLAVLAGLQL